MSGAIFFWVVAVALTAAVALLMVLAMLRRRQEVEASDHDVQVYRDQLREVERDLARGVVSEEEAERVRLEVSRRLLEADKSAQTAQADGEAPLHLTTAGAVALGAATFGGAVGLYIWLGAPGLTDQPVKERYAAAEAMREGRPTQAEIEAEMPLADPSPPGTSEEFLTLMTRLREAVSDNPDDIQGQLLLAQNEARLGNFRAAHPAQARVIELKGDEVTAADHAAYADLLVLAAGGYVSPEAEAAVNTVLTLEPRNGTARYYLGLMHVQSARPDLAFNIWNRLLNESSIQAPWVPPILGQIEQAANAAGARFNIPQRFLEASATPLPGPSAEDMQAAGDMAPEDRQEMIRGMVDGLAERLATEGGRAEEWARLITALGVLQETDRARAIWAEAQQVFSAYPDQLEIIEIAAVRAGVAE